MIISERPDVVQAAGVDAAQVKQMVNRGLMTFTSAPDIATAWQRLSITPQDIVGIKITTAGGPGLCTHPAIIRAICDGLQAAGVPRTQIIIWDKFPDKMRPAGFPPHAATDGQPAVSSVVPSNFDPATYYQNGLRGSLIWATSNSPPRWGRTSRR